MRYLPVILAAGLLLGCAPAEPPAVSPTARWAASFEARPQFEGVRANATAVRTTGGTTIQFELTGAEPGATHPWHVHAGTCATGGGIVGEADRYPPLQVGSDGRVIVTAVVDVEMEPGANYHINVHRSPGEMATIIACGDLREVGPRAP